MRKNGITALALAALMAGGTAAAQAQGASYTLGKVTFSGNEKVSTDELMAALPYQPGSKVDQAALQADINAVSAAYGKHNVGAKISAQMKVLQHTKAIVAITVEEQAPVAPVVRHVGNVADAVTVQGNKKVSTADILAASRIQPGGPVTNESLSAAQAAIIALYKQKNIGVSVQTNFANASEVGHVNITFVVTEKDDE
ncbi:MAG: hypothetical protein INR65_14320 [Gluconacetobacter diazotrophicus]|nr:hypothetical protein [Gluconacetobacter diazotrophicus]